MPLPVFQVHERRFPIRLDFHVEHGSQVKDLQIGRVRQKQEFVAGLQVAHRTIQHQRLRYDADDLLLKQERCHRIPLRARLNRLDCFEGLWFLPRARNALHLRANIDQESRGQIRLRLLLRRCGRRRYQQWWRQDGAKGRGVGIDIKREERMRRHARPQFVADQRRQLQDRPPLPGGEQVRFVLIALRIKRQDIRDRRK